jgi:hypothetical protein
MPRLQSLEMLLLCSCSTSLLGCSSFCLFLLKSACVVQWQLLVGKHLGYRRRKKLDNPEAVPTSSIVVLEFNIKDGT